MNERTTLIAQAFVGGAAVASLVALMLSGKKKRTVLLDDRNKPGGAGFVYNKAHIYDGIAHVSGQVAVQFLVGPGKRECSLEEEIRQVLQNLKEVVEKSGSSLDKVLKTDCLLSDIAFYPDFNKVYGEFFSDNPIKPARVCYAAKELPLGARIEVACTAFL
jgi:2-iminobutanoate/2-iminopropanoate deaminase